MKYFKIAFLFIGLSVFAQSKVGTVDVDYILTNMPEMKTVQEELKTYGAQMDLDLNKKVDKYKELAEAYKAGEIEFTIAQRKEKQTELLKLEEDIQKFQQNGATLMEIKQHDLLKPLYSKIEKALEKVATSQKYTQVLQRNADLVYVDANFDLTEAILAELGISIEDKTQVEQGK